MAADKGKKSKVAADDSEHIDGELVLSIEKLQEVQDELEKVNEEASDKIVEIEQKYNARRRPVYLKRNEIIKSINNFWMAAFCSHPALAELLTEEDQKIFKYLDSLDVEDHKDAKSGYSITFTFKENPYFEDTKLTKNVSFSDDGTTNVAATAIKWKEGMGPLAFNKECEKKGNKRLHTFESFFTWFDTREDLISDEVAEIIKEDLWTNPLKYFNNESEDDSDCDLYDDGESDDDEEEEEEEEGEEGEDTD